MFELVFCESAAGGLKMAKSPGDHFNCVTAIVGDIGNEPYEAECTCNLSDTAMDISSDVEVLTFELDIGDISNMDTLISNRKKLLDDLFAGIPGVSDGLWETNKRTLRRLQEAKETLEPIRMWISDANPAELCGLYFVSHLMVDVRTPLSVVRVPEKIEKGNSIVNYSSTGELPAEMFAALVKNEEKISELQRKINAGVWNSLMRENAPLRAIINGNLIGVPEDFYDFALRANIPDGEFRVAQLIGKTLCQISGVIDRWLFLRIQAMLQSGELILVSKVTDDYPYSDMIKRYQKS